MNFEMFRQVDFVKSIANNERWTISDRYKKPIDMRHLIGTISNNESLANGYLPGASFHNDNKPLVRLDEIEAAFDELSRISGSKVEPTNLAYQLNQSLDKFVVLDVEPKCPPEIRDELLTLPYNYCELSMSGHGFHMVFDTPKTAYTDILIAKTNIKEEHGWYEILLNHYVTFTGTICQPSELCVFKPIEEFYKVFDKLASESKIHQSKNVDTEDLPDIDDIPLYDDIVSLLVQAKYPKTLGDFNDDHSKFEFGVGGFYYKKLKMLLGTTKYASHKYTPQELMVLLHKIISDVIPYREKHDTIRDGLPWLLYTCKSIVSKDTTNND